MSTTTTCPHHLQLALRSQAALVSIHPLPSALSAISLIQLASALARDTVSPALVTVSSSTVVDPDAGILMIRAVLPTTSKSPAALAEMDLSFADEQCEFPPMLMT